MTAVVWFRRDLRLHEQPALRAALDAHDRVVCVHCLDDRLLHGRHASGSRTQFLLESLRDLDASMRERGGGLVVRHGPPERELPALAARVGADSLHFTADVSPFARRRQQLVAPALRAVGVELCGHPGLGVVDEPGAIRTQKGKPHTVFTPYLRAWTDEPRREVRGAPRKLPPVPARLAKGRVPTLESLRLRQEVTEPMPGGERAGRKRMATFLSEAIGDYASNHDALGADRTSRLSPYLHFGCVSARELEERLPRGEGPAAFRRQLCWRDFYAQVLLHNPANAHEEFQPRYRGALDWNDDDDAFTAWTQGQTGFPLVDAGMRQLRGEGFMHNRARLVVGSFLTKDLGIDWRRGERWFMRLLLDGDEANNNGNWQWIASVGVDPQPAFRRIYNPARHAERFDPDGRYVRRWVPELRRVPDRFLAEPWKMPEDVQRTAGCVIGADYPEPIVDRREARLRALERYRV
jgi:deoxyribodipyrimidine photo-lyase